MMEFNMVSTSLSTVHRTSKRFLLVLSLSGAAVHMMAMENKALSKAPGAEQPPTTGASTENPYFGLLPHELIVEISQKCVKQDQKAIYSLLSVNNQFRQALSPGLRELDLSQLSDGQLTDRELFSLLHHLPELRSLSLFGCDSVTDDFLSHLAQLNNLTTLNLNDCHQITDDGLAHLAQLKNLTTLNLTLCRSITDAGLTHLTQLKDLTILNLSYCKSITDDGFSHLAQLHNLTELNISGCENITGAGLAHLSQLKNLTTLDLSFCNQITDAGLAHLAQLKDLALLNLTGCWKITNAIINAFEVFYPGVIIVK